MNGEVSYLGAGIWYNWLLGTFWTIIVRTPAPIDASQEVDLGNAQLSEI